MLNVQQNIKIIKELYLSLKSAIPTPAIFKACLYENLKTCFRRSFSNVLTETHNLC